MTHAPFRNICATTAVYAVLALGSTPAWAQEVAPPLDAPAETLSASPGVAAPAPTIVLPDEAPTPPAPTVQPPVVSQPVVQQAPAAAVPPTVAADEPVRTAAPAARRPAAGNAAASQSTAPAVIQTQPIAPEPLPPAASLPLTTPAVAPSPAVTAPQERAQAASGDDWLTSPATGLAALLAALGLGAGAYFVARAGRRRRDDVYDDAHERQRLPAHAEPQPPAARREPIAVKALEPTPHPAAGQRIASEELVPAALPASPAVAVPAGPVPASREGRDALLDKMASAPPDADNPFTSRKARMRRARLILQAREQQHKEEASQPFDWRTYKSVAGNPAPATPPRVTV